jgi:hypothetical protein
VKIYFNAPYEIVLAACPGPNSYGCYGIRNNDTGVIEAYIGQLARAKQCADQYAQDLRTGLKSDRDSALELLAALKGAEGGGYDGNGSPLN